MRWLLAILPVAVFWAIGFFGDVLIGGTAGMAVGIFVPFIGGAWSGHLLACAVTERR